MLTNINKYAFIKFYISVLSFFIYSFAFSDGYFSDPRCTRKLNSCTNNVYLFAGGGASFLTSKPSDDYENKPKSSAVYGGGMGYTFNHYFRTDFSIFHRNKYKYRFSNGSISQNQDIKSTSFMLSGYLSPTNFYNLKPYIMAGIGIAHNNAGDINTNAPNGTQLGKTRNNFAWQAGLGLEYMINKHFGLDIGYKYIDMGKIETTNAFIAPGVVLGAAVSTPIEGKIRAHEVVLAASYHL